MLGEDCAIAGAATAPTATPAAACFRNDLRFMGLPFRCFILRWFARNARRVGSFNQARCGG
jgi:hypothetical protein